MVVCKRFRVIVIIPPPTKREERILSTEFLLSRKDGNYHEEVHPLITSKGTICLDRVKLFHILIKKKV